MENFFKDLSLTPRLCSFCPHLLYVGFCPNDPPQQKRNVRNTINFAIIFGGPLEKTSYWVENNEYLCSMPSFVYVEPDGKSYRQSNPSPCEKFFFSYAKEYARLFAEFRGNDVLTPLVINRRILNLLDEIFKVGKGESFPGIADILDALCAALLAEFVAGRQAAKEERDPARKRIMEAAAYLNLHLDTEVDFSALAEYAEIPLRTFRRKWHQCFEQSPKKYHLACRITEAKRLLTETDLHINRISAQVGFHDSFYFSKVFHKMTGMSPKQFREKNI